MRFPRYSRRTPAALAAALATLALAAPAAPARPMEQFFASQSSSQNDCDLALHTRAIRSGSSCEEQVLASRGTGASTRNVPSASPAPELVTDAGFSWGAAAIGAGTALALVMLGSLAAVALSRSGRIRTAR